MWKQCFAKCEDPRAKQHKLPRVSHFTISDYRENVAFYREWLPRVHIFSASAAFYRVYGYHEFRIFRKCTAITTISSGKHQRMDSTAPLFQAAQRSGPVSKAVISASGVPGI